MKRQLWKRKDCIVLSVVGKSQYTPCYLEIGGLKSRVRIIQRPEIVFTVNKLILRCFITERSYTVSPLSGICH